MAEYIRKDKALKIINRLVDRLQMEYIPDEIASMKPENVRENVRGEWLKRSLSFVCTVCGFNTGCFGFASKYCPNCGAKMRGE